MRKPKEKEYVNVQKAAEKFGIKKTRIYSLVSRGHIINRKIQGELQIEVISLYNYLEKYGEGKEVNCVICGKSMKYLPQGGRKLKYCSDKCNPHKLSKKEKEKRLAKLKLQIKELYYNQKMTQKEIAKKLNKSKSSIVYYMKKFNLKTKIHKKEKKCVVCGKKFMGKRNARYCSDKCKRTVYKKRYKIKCSNCGKKFFSAIKNQKYCSQQCGSEAAAKTMKNKTETKKCKWCGKKFNNDWAHRNQKYCSRKCRDAAWSKKYRAVKNKAFIEDVPFNYIYKRDNGKCQICGKNVNKEYKHPHPESPSIDHIIPLSKGGKHSKKNCQLAHLKCNCLKNNGSVGSKLRLFG